MQVKWEERGDESQLKPRGHSQFGDEYDDWKDPEADMITKLREQGRLATVVFLAVYEATNVFLFFW